MTDRPNEPINANESDAVVLERVQELSWALLDEQITDDELGLLDTLLLSDDNARRTYLECVQLHTGLLARFSAPGQSAAVAAPAKSPVLGFLNAGLPPVGLPLADDITE